MRMLKQYNLSGLTLLSLLVLGILLQSCTKDKCKRTYTYTKLEPIYLSYEEIQASTEIAIPRELKKPGKIYFKDDNIYINEISKGIHIINNSDPSSPQNIAFINIPGNFDIAIKGDILYADSYIDLLAIDISNPQNATIVKRIHNAFPGYNYPYYNYDSAQGQITIWEEKKVTVYEDDCDGNFSNRNWNGGFTPNGTGGGILLTQSAGSSAKSNGDGIGGSMARFTIYDNYLYTINNSDLQLFDISDPSCPQRGNKIYIGWNIETIYPYQDKLFIGSTSGMYIYDNIVPSQPSYISRFAHVSSCDPVVVEDNYAYVTLRSGNQCQGYTNQLDIIDISDLYNPKLLKSHNMDNPHGLGIDNKVLFICEGSSGLKVFNVDNPIDVNLLEHIKEMETYDVIPHNGLLMVIGSDGLYQYDYNNPVELELLSVIPVKQ